MLYTDFDIHIFHYILPLQQMKVWNGPKCVCVSVYLWALSHLNHLTYLYGRGIDLGNIPDEVGGLVIGQRSRLLCWKIWAFALSWQKMWHHMTSHHDVTMPCHIAPYVSHMICNWRSFGREYLRLTRGQGVQGASMLTHFHAQVQQCKFGEDVKDKTSCNFTWISLETTLTYENYTRE